MCAVNQKRNQNNNAINKSGKNVCIKETDQRNSLYTIVNIAYATQIGLVYIFYFLRHRLCLFLSKRMLLNAIYIYFNMSTYV